MPQQAETDSSLLRIFVSPDERRLRAGWRILVHGLAVMLLLLAAASIVALGMFALGHQSLEIFAGLSPIVEIIITLPAIILATFVLRRVVDRKSVASLGLKVGSMTIKDLLVGFLIPGLLMGGIFLFQWGLGWLKVTGFAWEVHSDVRLDDLLIWLIVYTGVGFQEEIVSRGYHLQNIAEGLNVPLGILISSLIFALLHLANPSFSLYSFLGLLASGYFLAYAWARTGQLWLSIGLHIGWNFFEGTIFGFPVSGIDAPTLISQEASGPQIITGGAFGPEAGLILIPTLIVGALLIHLYTRSSREGIVEPLEIGMNSQG